MTRQERERQLHRRMLIAAAVIAVAVLVFVLVIRARAGYRSEPEAKAVETSSVQQETQAEVTEAPAEKEAPAETQAPEKTETSAETETPAETEKPAKTEAAAETGTPAKTEAAAATETPAATEAPAAAETPAASSGKSLIEQAAEQAKKNAENEIAEKEQKAAERKKQAEEEARKADVRSDEELAAMSIEELTEYLRYKEVPGELLEFMNEYPESRGFVTNYLKRPEKEPEIDISGEVQKGRYPHFLQWDERWGYRDYGGSYFAVAGCGPTAMSVVYSGLTGKTDKDPYTMGKWAEEMGYYIQGSGTSWEMMWNGANQLGLGSWEVDIDELTILTTLQNGYPIIAAMSPGGDFTNFGHFIVLTGVDNNNNIIVRDSNSIERTQRTWKAGELIWQIAGLWAYSNVE